MGIFFLITISSAATATNVDIPTEAFQKIVDESANPRVGDTDSDKPIPALTIDKDKAISESGNNEAANDRNNDQVKSNTTQTRSNAGSTRKAPGAGVLLSIGAIALSIVLRRYR